MARRSRLSPDWPFHPHPHSALEASSIPANPGHPHVVGVGCSPLGLSLLVLRMSSLLFFGLLKSHLFLDPVHIQILTISPTLSSCSPSRSEWTLKTGQHPTFPRTWSPVATLPSALPAPSFPCRDPVSSASWLFLGPARDARAQVLSPVVPPPGSLFPLRSLIKYYFTYQT